MRAAILLAAGGSRRFGRGDKLMVRLAGKPLLLHALDCARASGARRVIVTVPSLHGLAGRLLAGDPQVQRVVARRHRDGLSASLAAALAAVRPIEREVMIFLGDMPFAAPPRAMRLAGGSDAVRPFVDGVPGHPLLVRTAIARRSGARGDRGLALRLVKLIGVRGAAGNLLDIDTRTALRHARLAGARRRRQPF